MLYTVSIFSTIKDTDRSTGWCCQSLWESCQHKAVLCINVLMQVFLDMEEDGRFHPALLRLQRGCLTGEGARNATDGPRYWGREASRWSELAQLWYGICGYKLLRKPITRPKQLKQSSRCGLLAFVSPTLDNTWRISSGSKLWSWCSPT